MSNEHTSYVSALECIVSEIKLPDDNVCETIEVTVGGDNFEAIVHLDRRDASKVTVGQPLCLKGVTYGHDRIHRRLQV